jgi:two-component system sensor histidine kinase MtrB
LLAAFLLVTVLAVTGTAWSSARSASSSLVGAAQRQLTDAVTSQVQALAPNLHYPPDQDTLNRLRAALGPGALVTYRDLRSADAAGADLVTGAVRAAVHTRGRVAVQRITAGGTPWLLIGTPLMVTPPSGAPFPSGIEVYAVRDLSGVQQQIREVVVSAVRTAGLAVLVAVVVSVAAASSVLRPLSGLRDHARRLAAGELEARAEPRGADELAYLAVTFNQMAASLQASITTTRRMEAEAKRFAADVSHELRTPLSTLTAVVEVLSLAAGEMETDVRESVQLAVTEVHRLVRLIEDLMEVSRFDAGTAELRLEEVDPGRAVRDCLLARGWADRVDFAVAGAATARLDRRRLDVIVANLVGNALRHGRPPVGVRVEVTPEHVRVEVTDAGPGLPEQASPRVFERFYKSDPARTRTPGSGLGLSIALANARLHGGDITAGNRAGGGARFVVCLPGDREDR